MSKTKKKKVLAIASGGGHWVQLLRLRPAFNEHHVVYATVDSVYQADLPDEELRVISDATSWNKMRLLVMSIQILFHIVRIRPHIVISTGAAPGYVAIRLAKVCGARTIWVDSMANADQLSLSGVKIGRHADLWLTQWPHLAKEEGPQYKGAVL